MDNRKNNGLAIASLVLGIVSTVCCCMWYFGCITGIAGLAIGIVAFRGEEPGTHGISIAGIITSSVGLLLSILVVVALVLMAALDIGSGTQGTGISSGSGTALQFLLF